VNCSFTSKKDRFRALHWCVSDGWLPCLLTLFLIPSAFAEQGKILGTEGTVDFARGKGEWTSAVIGGKLDVTDRVRTQAKSRAMVQLAELGRLRINERTTLEILPPRETTSRATIDLKAGAIYFFTRGRPREFQVQTPYALAASRGTEFSVTIAADGTSRYQVFEGEVDLTNQLGGVTLESGEAGMVKEGKPPVKTAVIEASNLVQWWLYYPGVLDVDELELTANDQRQLSASLEAYRAGDPLNALEQYPASRTPQSDAERVYHAALLLAVGQVKSAEKQLSTMPGVPLAHALRVMIDATHLRSPGEAREPTTASEFLARSYEQQSRFDLAGALKSAQSASDRSPEFGFAWVRVAELEFSFGRTEPAIDALKRALETSPQNAQAWALKGFLAAARSRFAEAEESFDQSIALDPALGNAWLGRGLVRLRRGQREAGREDLQTAAALEPNRSVLRSYLGKAFDAMHETVNAEREFHLAKQLDQSDPTPWLYSALLLRQELRFNEAVSDLEKSAALNDNRRVYRSRMLLDQDRAVRGASLATIYQSVGLDEVSVREAARAVDSDYANYSAHLFLSDSFNALRDPTDFNLRYDTPWLNELLLANLLAPVGAGALSRNVSQHEYSRLFETDRIGLSTDTELRSDGRFKQVVSQFANHGRTSYSLDLDYRHHNGVRPNNDLDRIEWFSQIKHQITPRDSVLLFAEYRDFESGDNFQYYDPASARPNFRYEESQTPNLFAAYHHEWAPGIHSLLLAGRLENDQRFSDTDTTQLILSTNGAGGVTAVSSLPFDVNHRAKFEIYTAELNQIVQGERQRLVAGGRYQGGDFHTTDQLSLSTSAAAFAPFFNSPPAGANIRNDFERISTYGYYTREIFPRFMLTAGLSYDRLTYPTDFRDPPTFSGETTRDQVSPKASLMWNPIPKLTFRSIYARGLGGVSFDQSYRLEPTQLAGFAQTLGSTIPESVVGAVSAPDTELIGGAMDVKLNSRTYMGVQVESLNADVDRQQGAFAFDGLLTPILPGSVRQLLDYQETSVTATINQLLSDEWSVGASYRFTRSELRTLYPALVPALASADTRVNAGLHQAAVYALFNHPSGFFARAEGRWHHQNNHGYTPALVSEDFFHENLWLGWRLKRQRGELSVGALNIGDQDYRLNPLTLYSEAPRERTFVVRLKINL
jgi:tetratricopeptide (TPR) repeat protein